MSYIEEIILLVPVLLLSLSLHEYSHGLASYLLGDPTPRLLGRLTLNPLAHLDPLGSLALILTRRFGWAKPVPINPRYYKNPRKGMMLVGIAGPAANFILAIFFALIMRIVFASYDLILRNGYIFGPAIPGYINTLIKFLILAININLWLGIFNLVPIPPLDGSKILRGFLPPRFDRYFLKLEGPQGMFLILLLAYAGIISGVLGPVINFFFDILV